MAQGDGEDAVGLYSGQPVLCSVAAEYVKHDIMLLETWRLVGERGHLERLARALGPLQAMWFGEGRRTRGGWRAGLPCHALTKRYAPDPPPANNGITPTVEAGELFGVFGPNGPGKTTLVRQLVGLLRPASGTIQLFGWDVVRDPDLVPRRVAYFGQQTVALRPHTVRKVLLLAGVLRGMPTSAARRQADELPSRFGLDCIAAQGLAGLSGGQERLAVLLSTFMADPSGPWTSRPTSWTL